VSRPVYAITLRGLLGSRRTLALGLLAAIPVVVAVILSASSEVDPETYWARLVQRLAIPTITAFVAVVVGASAIGDDREDGTILYLAATPLSRLRLVASKVAASWSASMLLLAPSALLAGALALGGDTDGPQLLWPLAGIALAALCYCAVWAWLSLAVRRPVVLGALYILLWEGSIATFADSADRLSIAAYARAVAVEGVIEVNAPDVSAAAAALVLLVASGLALWGAARRLTRTELP
jgi:ABC-2 type transport system permease protein